MRIENRTPAPHTSEQEPEKYHEATTVNGVEIEAGWDDDLDCYTISLPQIEIGGESVDRGVYGRVITLNRRPELAKQAFDYAVARAGQTSDLYGLFKKVEGYCNWLKDTDRQNEE